MNNLPVIMRDESRGTIVKGTTKELRMANDTVFASGLNSIEQFLGTKKNRQNTATVVKVAAMTASRPRWLINGGLKWRLTATR
jgi:hypothetical protein